MPKSIGRNINTADFSIINAGVGLNTSTSVTIAVAQARRVFFHVNNDNIPAGFWVKLQAASVDDDKKGIFVSGKNGATPYWEMPSDNIYTGEISAIADTDSPSAFVTEF